MRRWDVYRGRRTVSRRVPSLLLLLLTFLFVAGIALFFALPGYLVYTKDDVHLELPFMDRATPAPEEAPEPSALPEEEDGAGEDAGLTAELVVKTPDYSTLALANGAGLEIRQSVYIPYEQVNEAGLAQAVAQARALEVKTLVMELRDETGMLLYLSQTETAVGYALNGTWDLTEFIKTYHDQGYYLVAVISACVDATMASRNTGIALKTASGFPYSDTKGAWLDPWNAEVRQLTIDLTAELMEMGFDEVVLNHVEHPTAEVMYTRSMSGELTRTAAVTNYAIAVREGLADTMAATGARLSVMMDTQAMNDDTIDNGQNLGYLYRIFDRVYEFTETYQEANKVIALGVDSTERFVPIISWTFPGACWSQNFFGAG